jgi:hypothetical protein
MYELDLEEVLQLLRTAYIEESWDGVQEAIDMIHKSDNEKEFNEIDEDWN